MDNPVKVPTVKGMSSAFKDLGIGALGGAIILFATSIFGGLGFLAAPLLAGSMLKGESGKVITTISGVALGIALLSGMGGSTSSSSSGGV